MKVMESSAVFQPKQRAKKGSREDGNQSNAGPNPNLGPNRASKSTIVRGALKFFGASRRSAIIFARRGADCAEPATSEMRRNPSHSPRSSAAEPRRQLLLAVRSFVRTASACSGVLRIALIGSLATSKAIPKDADVLVTIDGTMNLEGLARAGRRLKGSAQTINLGADIFLADVTGRYL